MTVIRQDLQLEGMTEHCAAKTWTAPKIKKMRPA